MTKRARILITDDDPDIRKVLSILLQSEHDVVECCDGSAALRAVKEYSDADLIILDVMMPGMDGFETCEKLREHTNAPVLFLTARTSEEDRVSAYTSGGDDYLSKPFSKVELMAKVTSLLRRYREYMGKPQSAAAIGDLEVDTAARTVRLSGRELTLTDTEYSILEFLLSNRGNIMTAEQIYEGVWGEKFFSGSGNTVMVHLLNLRRKIEADPSNPKVIRTVWGRGYRID